MPGVPTGCCGGLKPNEPSKVNVSPRGQNNQQDNQQDNNHQDNKVDYGAKEPCCCCSSRCNCGSRKS